MGNIEALGWRFKVKKKGSMPVPPILVALSLLRASFRSDFRSLKGRFCFTPCLSPFSSFGLHHHTTRIRNGHCKRVYTHASTASGAKAIEATQVKGPKSPKNVKKTDESGHYLGAHPRREVVDGDLVTTRRTVVCIRRRILSRGRARRAPSRSLRRKHTEK